MHPDIRGLQKLRWPQLIQRPSPCGSQKAVLSYAAKETPDA